MATGRTLFRYIRAYVDGLDLSGNARKVGPLAVEFDEVDVTAPLIDECRNFLLGTTNTNITPGTLSALFDNTAITGSHTILKTPAVRKLMIPIGIQAAPAQGDPVFCGAFQQLGYKTAEDGGAIICNIPFGQWDTESVINYTKPHGVLLHAKGAEIIPNTAIGVDDNAGASAAGWWLQYQILSMNAAGTATISVEDAAVNTNPSFSPLTGATSGPIGFASTPCAGIVTGAIDAAVYQYLRFQILLAGGATTCTFLLAFCRG